MTCIELKNLESRLNVLCKEHNLRTVLEIIPVLTDRNLEEDSYNGWVERYETCLEETCLKYMRRDEEDEEIESILIQRLVRRTAHLFKLKDIVLN